MKTRKEIDQAREAFNEISIEAQRLKEIAELIASANGGRYLDADRGYAKKALEDVIIQLRDVVQFKLMDEINEAENALAAADKLAELKRVRPFEVTSGGVHLGYSAIDKRIYLKSNGDSWAIGIIDEYANSLKFGSILCTSSSQHNYGYLLEAIKFVETVISKQSAGAGVYINTIQVGCCKSVSVKCLCKFINNYPKIVEHIKMALGKYTVNVYERK